MWISVEEGKDILKAQGKNILTRHVHTHFLSDTEERLTVLPECELLKRQALSSMLLVLHDVMARDACLRHFCTGEKNPNVFE